MKLAVLSNENLNPWVNWSTLGPPLLHELAGNTGAQLVAPPPFRLQNVEAWATAFRNIVVADVLFWMQGASRPETPLHILSILRGKVRRSALVIDAWRHLLPKIGAFAVLQRLDPCFVAFREAYEELRTRFPKGRFEWLPFGVDTEVFSGIPGERPIFAFSMGRRHEPLHEALIRYCSERNLEYRYNQQPGQYPNPSDLGSIVGRSQYFVVTPPDLSHPTRTGGFSPFVMRYLEGLSAGCRLIGVLPRSGEYELLLPTDAILQVAPDGSDLAAKLDADRRNTKVKQSVERARLWVREHHSWSRRAQYIFERLTSGTSTSVELAPSPTKSIGQ